MVGFQASCRMAIFVITPEFSAIFAVRTGSKDGARSGIGVYKEAAIGRTLSEEQSISQDIAFDFCILQKVLPKLHGNRQELEEPLAQLLFFSFGQPSPGDPAGSFDRFLPGIPPLLPSGEEEPLRPRFPRTAAKVYRMWSTLRSRGFVSFVE